jgi:MFS-type transporter involved in bile tolerance (Atg22 family)
MCFSAEADFVSGAVIGVVGVAALREVRHAREVPLAVLPLAFAIHQVTEGLVWLGLEGHVPRLVGDAAMYAYLFYAWALLPFFAPLAIYLVEPSARRRRWMGVLVAIGAIVAAALFWALVHHAISAHIVGHTIDYRGVGDSGNVVTVLYVLATCGTFLLSSQRRIVWFGIANVVAVAVIAWEQSTGLTSLWCLWAGIVSVLIYLQLRDWRRAGDGQPAIT